MSTKSNEHPCAMSSISEMDGTQNAPEYKQ